jgi:stage II sporulation protein P
LYLAAAAALVLAPVIFTLIRLSFPAAVELTRKAAMLSAVLSMPEGGLAMLEERFNSEIFYPDELEGRPDPSASPESGQPSSSSSPLPSDPQRPDASVPADPPPDIPEEYRGPLLTENMAGSTASSLIPFGSAYVKSYVTLSNEKILDYLARPMELKLSQTDAPQVLIVHTHATEAFNEWDYTYYDKRNSWRTTDNSKNMVAVGEELARVLSENGIGVIHDKTQHDYPSYNGSYERSAETIKGYLSRYPTIKVVLDLHRDAIEREGGVIVKPTTVIDGQKAAQLMIIACCDNGQMNMPRWDQNFRFAAALADAVEERYPTLTRPIFFCHRKYNQDLTTGSLLLEFGSHASTLKEAVYTANLAGQVLAELLKGTISS